MSRELKPDICVIGGGSGGLSVAAIAASLGASVVLCERHLMGGDCLNVGCVPSKALIAAARRAHDMRSADIFGIRGVEPEVSMAKVRDHIRGVIAGIAPTDSVARFRGLGATVLTGPAAFTDANTVRCEGHDIRARRFVVATGSRPGLPPIPGLAEVGALTNETVFDLDVLPKRLLVIGAGPIGLELAQSFRRLGSAVTVLEAQKPLAKDDPELAAIVLESLARDGVDIRAGARISRAERRGDTVALILEGRDGEERLEGTHLLVAAGRRVNVEDLGLESAGIAFDGKGIKVDAGLKTANKRVYAVGDVTGGLQFTHAAGYQASLVVRNALFRLPAKYDPRRIPWCTYTDPELAQVGLAEDAARAAHGRIQVLRWSFHENDRASAAHEGHGHVKMIADAKGRILGVGIAGPHAGELIAAWALAIAKGASVRDVAGVVLPYPTLSEAGKRAAVTSFAGLARSPVTRRLIAFMRWLDR